MPLTYCIKTRLPAVELSNKIMPFLKGGHFLLAEIKTENLGGFLPKAAWDWFTANHQYKNIAPQELGYSALATLGSLLPPIK